MSAPDKSGCDATQGGAVLSGPGTRPRPREEERDEEPGGQELSTLQWLDEVRLARAELLAGSSARGTC